MLTTPHRLTKERDFKEVSRTGKSFFSPFLSIRRVPNGRSYSRLAVVASTKVSKKATQRNRLKRQIREIIRRHYQALKPGFDIVVYLKAQALGRPYRELEQTLILVFTKAHLLP